MKFRTSSRLMPRREIYDACKIMGPVEIECFAALVEAMVTGKGVRDAAILFLKSRGVAYPDLVTDKILNDAEGVA